MSNENMPNENPEARLNLPELSQEQITVRLWQCFQDTLKSGDHILDLGARDGEIDKRFLDKEADLHITAVDNLSDSALEKQIIRNQRFKDPRLTWLIQDVNDYIATLSADGQFQGIFAQNIFQFLEKQRVLAEFIPRLQKSLTTGSPFAIRTFSAEPIPAFDTPMTSLYQLDDFVALFPSIQWGIDLAEATVFNSLSLRNDQREFSIIDFLARKK